MEKFYDIRLSESDWGFLMSILGEYIDELRAKSWKGPATGEKQFDPTWGIDLEKKNEIKIVVMNKWIDLIYKLVFHRDTPLKSGQ